MLTALKLDNAPYIREGVKTPLCSCCISFPCSFYIPNVMEHKTSVRDRCRECDRLFQDIAKIDGCQSFHVVNALHQQFEQWASNLGVYAGNQNLSLDAKLAYSDSLQTLVLELLQIIKRNLGRVETLERTEHSDLDAQAIVDQMNDTDQEGLSTILVESLRALESAVESLLRLGLLLQQSSASNLTQRVINFVKRKDDGTLERIIYLHLKHRFHDQAKVDGNRPAALSLYQQLAKSVSFRCFRVHYMRSHADKKRIPPSSHEPATATSATKQPSPTDHAAQMPAQSRMVATPQHLAVPDRANAVLPPSVLRIKKDAAFVPTRTETDPSIPDSNYVKSRYKESNSSFFGTNSVVSIRLRDDIKYPKKPAIDSSAKSAPCPYCRKTFSKWDYDKPQWWERHVDQDLHLYTCIAPECVDPPQLFARFEEWKTHMDSQHPTGWMMDVHTPVSWCCDGDGKHDEMTFVDESSIELHISEQHPEHSEDLELEVWKELCKISTPRPEHTCPICNMIPEKISNVLKPDVKGQATAAAVSKEKNNHRQELLRHVAQHLKEIGLMSIHYLYEEEEEGAEPNITDRKAESRESLADNIKGLPPGRWNKDGEWVPPVEPYFDQEFLEYVVDDFAVPELSEPVTWDIAQEDSPEAPKLKELIISKFAISRFKAENRQFMPEGELSKLITSSVVKGMLEQYSDSEAEREELGDFILTKAIKIFAITFLIGVEDEQLFKAMALFKINGLDDDKLPLQETELWEVGVDQAAGAVLVSNELGWKPEKIGQFYQQQWTFLAHVIHAATSVRGSKAYLEDRRILPFVEVLDDGFDGGGFGPITKYRVHPKHLDDPESPLRDNEQGGKCVFVRELQARITETVTRMDYWDREASALSWMNSLRQQHIVRFITAFRQDVAAQGAYYLVFEWADGGNLSTLWATFHRPSLTATLIEAAVRQILGLAEALNAVHYPHDSGSGFRHGNLKPENILWFKGTDGGQDHIATLKIGGWELGMQHSIEDKFPSKIDYDHGTRRYEPPEQSLGLGAISELGPTPRTKRSRLGDIWSMGCITLEFIVWLLYGLEGLKRFNSEIRTDDNQLSPFYQLQVSDRLGHALSEKSAEVHPEVTRWMDHMADLSVCRPESATLGRLLGLVRTRLLVINLPPTLEADLPLEAQILDNLGVQQRLMDANDPEADSGHPDIPKIIISDEHGFSSPHQFGDSAPPRPLGGEELRWAAPTRGRARSREFLQRMEEICLSFDHEMEYSRIAYSSGYFPFPQTRVAWL